MCLTDLAETNVKNVHLSHQRSHQKETKIQESELK